MLLQHCTWQEIDAYLERSKGVVVPIGSTEQHGPMGLIGADALCPEVIAPRRVCERTALPQETAERQLLHFDRTFGD